MGYITNNLRHHLIMRAVIFLAIVGVAFGLNICKGVNKNDISSAYATARLGAAAIFGSSCPGFDLDTVAFSGACKSLVKQATCYGLKAASHYDRDVINYGHLAKDVKNIESLGNQACAEAPACFRQVKAAMEDCLANNANFVQDTIDAAETAYKENFEAQVAEWANSNSGSLLGDLASMAMDRFSSADDVQKGIEAYDYVIENYEATLNEYAAAVGSGLSPTAIAEATKIKDDVVAEFQCVQEVYSANQPGCA